VRLSIVSEMLPIGGDCNIQRVFSYLQLAGAKFDGAVVACHIRTAAITHHDV